MASAAAAWMSVVTGRPPASWRFGVGMMVWRRRRMMENKVRLSKASAGFRARVVRAMRLAALSAATRLLSERKVESGAWEWAAMAWSAWRSR